MVPKLSWIGNDESIDLDPSLDISKPVIHHSLSMNLDGVFRNECFDILTTKISTRITMKTKSAYQSDSEGLSFLLWYSSEIQKLQNWDSFQGEALPIFYAEWKPKS